MTKKMRRLITLIIFFLIFSGIVTLISVKNRGVLKTQQPTGTQEKERVFDTLSPGISTKEDLDKKLGEPLDKKKDGNNEIFEYQTESQYRFHSAILEDDKVILIKEVITNKDKYSSNSIIQKYGNPSYKLYNQKSPNDVFNFYVYDQLGLAYLGHEDGTLLEIWHFQPIDINIFIEKWAPDWSINPPNIQQY